MDVALLKDFVDIIFFLGPLIPIPMTLCVIPRLSSHYCPAVGAGAASFRKAAEPLHYAVRVECVSATQSR